MGEGEGAAVHSRHNDTKVSTETMPPDRGGGEDEDLWGPPSPLFPSPAFVPQGGASRRQAPRGGKIFGRICLINYGLLSNSAFIKGFSIYHQIVVYNDFLR
jgi:hypothetical protein